MKRGEHMHDPENRFEKWLMEFHPEEYIKLASPNMTTTESNYEGGGTEESRKSSKKPKKLRT